MVDYYVMDFIVVKMKRWAASLWKITASDLVRQYNNSFPGFYSLRIFLSFSILFWHGFTVSNGMENDLFQNNAIGALGRLVLPMFFCLSGFLIAGSAARLRSLKVFMLFRFLRIIPALLVEVTLSAFVLGPLFTTHTLKDYLTDFRTWAYFGNVVGNISYMLPGVFRLHPIPMVNLNLWTMVPELYCYLMMTVLFLLGIMHNRKWFLLSVLQGSILFFVLYPNPAWDHCPLNQYILMICFWVGCLSFLYAEYIPINKYLFWVSLIIAYVCFNFEPLAIPGILATAYCTVYLGLSKLPTISFLERGDYSYGIYLYGFPITQTIWHLVPDFRTGFVLFGLSAPLTFCFAALSWHYIEKPALSLKRYFLPKKIA